MSFSCSNGLHEPLISKLFHLNDKNITLFAVVMEKTEEWDEDVKEIKERRKQWMKIEVAEEMIPR
jgi:hypothetical protein